MLETLAVIAGLFLLADAQQAIYKCDSVLVNTIVSSWTEDPNVAEKVRVVERIVDFS